MSKPDTRPIGIATTTSVRASAGSGSEKQVAIEKLGSRHTITSFDAAQGKNLWHKVKARIEHQGAPLLALAIKPDSWRGTEHEKYLQLLVVSAHQELWAARGREQPADWVAAKDLIPGEHAFPLGYVREGGAWSELAWVKPPPWEQYQNASVHELVLVGGDSYLVDNIWCRTSSVPAPPPVQKRVLKPFKDVPAINFAPQPKTLSLAQAEVWYRKSSTILPHAVQGIPSGPDQVKAMWALKHRLRDVAVRALIEVNLRHEFINKHPIAELEALLPADEALSPPALTVKIEEAVRLLESPGDRRYSEFTGGMESHRVWSEAGYWSFDGKQWVLEPKER